MVINSETYNDILASPELLKAEHVSELKSIINEYPYFQSARALYLKGLKNQDSFRYNNELKRTAAYTTDRSILFEFITSSSFENKENLHDQISQKIVEEEEVIIEEKPVKEEKELEIGKPLSFSSQEKHSFNEWLQLSAAKPIVRKPVEAAEKEKLDKFSIIDKFIQNNPKIIPVRKGEKVELELPKNKVDKSLMTQTLAKVYLEQKKYSKAIKAYEILSLKYPEKSGFFADQIKKIRNLQKNKS